MHFREFSTATKKIKKNSPKICQEQAIVTIFYWTKHSETESHFRFSFLHFVKEINCRTD